VTLGLGCGPCNVLNTMVHILAEVQETSGSGDNARAAAGRDHRWSLLQPVIAVM
jgi:hypothetical protein